MLVCLKDGNMPRSVIVLLTAVAGCVLAAAGHKQITDGGCAALAGRMEVLEDIVRQQAQVIDDLVNEKENWQYDKATVMADSRYLRQDMASLRLTVKRLETFLSPVNGTEKDNKADGQSLEWTKTIIVNKSHNHAVFVRSDDVDPLVPVMTQLTERVNQVSAGLQALTNQVSTGLQALMNQVNEVNEALPKSSASLFVNWGSFACPNSSELVYSGVVGGSNYNETGAPGNFLCLPLADLNLTSHLQGRKVNLYGGEYQTRDGEYETYDEHTDKDPVCAVCRSSRATNVMIPAMTVCPTGWTSEYSGWLMGGAPWDAAPSEFICVNAKMEERQGSAMNLDGKLMHYTATVCGSLPCPPYVDGLKVTCVVCSK